MMKYISKIQQNLKRKKLIDMLKNKFSKQNWK